MMKRVSKRRREMITGYLFLLPFLALTTILVAYPAAQIIALSFTDMRLPDWSSKWSFVGFDQYVDLFTSEEFVVTVMNTIVWTVGSVAGHVLLGLGMALVLNERFKGKGFFTGLFLQPYVLPASVTALTFMWIFTPSYGAASYLLEVLGLTSEPVNFLGSVDLAMPAVLITNIWRGWPFVMVMVMAALAAVPSELYDSAKVDGAGRVDRFLHITLPWLKPVMGVIILFRVMWTWNFFDIVFIMTKGGPLNKTTILPLDAYKISFEGMRTGQGSAVGVVLLLSSLIFYLVYVKTAGRRR